MFLNDNLISTLNLIRENNEEAYNLIVKYVSECPYVRIEDYSRNPLTIQTFGSFNGKVGTWTILLKLDTSKKVNSIDLNFEGAPSSRLPYTENLLLKVEGFNLSKSYFGTELASMNLTRIPNYRYASPLNARLSSQDVHTLTNTNTIATYRLRAKYDIKTNKYLISSNERIGDIAQATELITRDCAELEA